MSLAYYKRFPRDFLEGTIGLPFEVKCAYAVVLDLIYMRDGRLPDDARYIAGQLGCSVRKWTAILDALILANKLQRHDGIISNFRADYLLEETSKYQDKQAENRRAPNKINGLPSPSLNQAEVEAEEEPESKIAAADARGADDWPIGDAKVWASALAEHCATVRLDPARQGGLALTAGRIFAWKAAGASWTYDILPVIEGMVRKQGPPIKSWKYFDDAVAQSIASNRQALDIPAHERSDNPRPPSSPNGRMSNADLDRHGAALALARRRGAQAGGQRGPDEGSDPGPSLVLVGSSSVVGRSH